MRIAIVTDNSYPNVNGIAYSTERLARQLKHRRHHVLLIAPSSVMRNEWSEREGVKVLGVRSLPTPLYEGLRWSILGCRRPVQQALRDFQPDLIHLQTHFALGHAALHASRALGVPVMATNHFTAETLVHHLQVPAPLRQIVTEWSWRYLLRTYKRLDLVTAPTATALSMLQRVGFSGCGQVVSNGVDLGVFSPQNVGAPLRGYLLPRGPKLLFVGRLDNEKNIAFAIRAFAHAVRDTDGYFIVAGSGSERHNLEAIARNLGIVERVIFTGFVRDRDLPALYGAVDGFVMPGLGELQSIATMEAMATGLPIIAVESAALPELVRNGVNGFLVQPGDTARLASCMVNVLSDRVLSKKMGQASLRDIRNHDINVTVSAFEELYARLALGAVRSRNLGVKTEPQWAE